MRSSPLLATLASEAEGLETHRALLREKYGHPDIVVTVDGQSGADWLIDYFSDRVRSGVSFEADQTVQVGWALLKLIAGAAGELAVCEPDFTSMPVHWIAGSSRAMRHLLLQREVCDQIGEEPCYPSMIQTGVVSPGFIGGRSAFTMSRDEEGWLFKSEDDEGHDAALCSLYAIGIERTAAIPFLALPPGAEVDWKSGSADIRFDGRHYSSQSNPFLGKLIASPTLG